MGWHQWDGINGMALMGWHQWMARQEGGTPGSVSRRTKGNLHLGSWWLKKILDREKDKRHEGRQSAAIYRIKVTLNITDKQRTEPRNGPIKGPTTNKVLFYSFIHLLIHL
jgi:hypothetical protein